MSEIVISNLITQNRRVEELSEREEICLRKSLGILKRDQDMEMLHDHILDAFWDYRNKVDYWRLRSLSGFRNQVLGYEVKSTLNRLAFNVLNLSKLFFDKHYHERDDKCFVYEQTGSLDDKEKVRIKRDAIKSNNLRYLVGCKLRNRSQHGYMPVSQFSSGFKLRQSDAQRFIVFKIEFGYEQLRQLGIPKSRIKPDIRLDLTEILDGYVHAVSEMHMHNRSITEEKRSSSEDYLSKFIFEALAPENGDSCFVDLRTDENEDEYIGVDCFELANHLRKKHPYATDYSKIAFGLNGY